MIIAIGLKTGRYLREETELKYRHYAVVEGMPNQEKANWKHYLVKNSIGLFKPQTYDKGNESNVEVQHMNSGNGMSLLKFSPEEYFKGQLRAQSALQGMPIVGDKRYGSKLNPLQRTCLHIFSLSFNHPKTEKPMEVKTRVPSEFLRLIKGK